MAEPAKRTTEPDLDSAQRFLDIIAPKAKAYTFQTFDDDKHRKDKKLASIIHGSLSECAAELMAYQQRGAGVFVTLNRTDLTGRSDKNIKQVRAVCADLDGAPLQPVLDHGLKPHVIVESSPDRWHCYWLLRMGKGKNFPLDQFKGVQRAIAAEFDGDPEIAKLAHVARLPGFFHQKETRFLTRIFQHNEIPRYSTNEIIKAFPPREKPHAPPKSDHGKLVFSAAAPLNCAKGFIEHVCAVDDADGFVFYRGNFYAWAGTHYKIAEKDHVKKNLYTFFGAAVTPEGRPFNPNDSKNNSIIAALQGMTYIPPEIQPPFILAPESGFPGAGNVIACENGLLDLDTRELKPHNPHVFVANCLPFAFNPNALKPKLWLNTLKQWWPGVGDKRARLSLQEIFGLFLTNQTKYHLIFLIIGPTRSGKGVITNVIQELLGKDNVSNPSFQSISTNFGLEDLIDKRAAIFTDARLSGKVDLSALTERLLKISGGDQLSVPRKYKTDWTGKLDARFLIFSNELPSFKDSSGVIAKRFFILEMERSFFGKENRELSKNLKAELPGILNWALRGLDRINKRDGFKMPESSEVIVKHLEALASPVAAFVAEWCVTGPRFQADTNLIYDAYFKWSENAGMKPNSKIVFGRDLRSIVRGCRLGGSHPNRTYKNIDLSPEGLKEYERLESLRINGV